MGCALCVVRGDGCVVGWGRGGRGGTRPSNGGGGGCGCGMGGGFGYADEDLVVVVGHVKRGVRLDGAWQEETRAEVLHRGTIVGLGILMRGDAQQAAIEADKDGVGIGAGHGERQLVGVAGFAHGHRGRRGQRRPGVVHAEERIEVGESAVCLIHEAHHFAVEVAGGGSGEPRREGAASEGGEKGVGSWCLVLGGWCVVRWGRGGRGGTRPSNGNCGRGGTRPSNGGGERGGCGIGGGGGYNRGSR